MFEFSWMWVAMAFCGGVFGAAVGALPSFVLCGIGALLGAGAAMVTGGDASTFDMLVTWGPLVGPQTAFAGGAVAAVYAASRGKLDTGRDICTPLLGLNSPDVLMIGGIFGVLGALLTFGCSKLPFENNAIATAIVLTMISGRLIFGKTGLFGKVAPGTNRWAGSDAGCWVTWQHDWQQILLVAVAIGLPAALLAKDMPNSGLIIFGLGCFIFAFMLTGAKVPVFHNIALATFLAVTATGNVLWGLAFAILVAFVCELAAMLFCAHGDSHIDPPTVSLTVTCIVQPILIKTGLMKPMGASFDFIPLVMVVVFATGFPLLLTSLRAMKPADEVAVTEPDEAV